MGFARIICIQASTKGQTLNAFLFYHLQSYIDDQFPAGMAFKYLGQDSFSLGAQGNSLAFHTKTPNGIETMTISGEHYFNTLPRYA